MKRKDKDPKTGQFLKGNRAAVRSGEYSKRLPLRIQRHGEAMRAGLILNLGPTEKDMTTAQLVLTDKAVALYQVTCAIEAYIRKQGVFIQDKFDPVLGNHYTNYINTLRLTLRELGVNKRQADKILDLKAYVENKYGKEDKASSKPCAGGPESAKGQRSQRKGKGR